MRWVIRAACRRLAAAWVLGDRLRPTFSGLVPAERVRVVPNGVPDPGALALRRGEPRRTFTILYLGQLSDLKGVDNLIDAFGTLGGGEPEARLVIAGAWLTRRDETRIRARVAASPAAARIDLHGVVGPEEKARLLAAADVLTLPVRSHEGQPLVVLEAMAAGLPVVTTDVPVIPEMVTENVHGHLRKPGDIDGFVEALRGLVRDPVRRRAMGAGNRTEAETRYDVPVAVETLSTIFDRIMA
jgi:glycosyltransferase involved in cell wall biosynthesis